MSRHSRYAILFYLLFVEGLLAGIWTATIPGEGQGPLLGFTAARFVAILLIFITATLLAWLGLKCLQKPVWAAKKASPFFRGLAKKPGWWFFFGVVLLLALMENWIPSAQSILERLRPGLLWISLGGLQALLVGWDEEHPIRWKIPLESLRLQPAFFQALIWSMGIMAGVWILILATGWGVDADIYFWNEAGVPVLGTQVNLALVMVMAAQRLGLDQINNRRWLDWVLAAGVWAVAFSLWHFTPLLQSPQNPGPYPPNFEFYPYSDSAIYDTSAHYLRMGEGISNGVYMDKPLYVLLVSLYQWVAGPSLTRMLVLQVAFLGLLPVSLYFLGRKLHSRQAGLLTAILVIFQWRNAIAGSLFTQTSHVKMLLTETTSALMVALVCLAGVHWLQAPRRRVIWGLTTGGLLGMAALVRSNGLVLVAALLLLALIAYRQSLRRLWMAAVLFVLAVSAAMAPFMFTIPEGFDQPYLVDKIRRVIDTRYSPDPVSPTPTPDIQSNAGMDLKPDLMILPQTGGENSAGINPSSEPSERLAFIPRHFLHNEVMAVLSLPNTFLQRNLKGTLQAPYWRDITSWQGELQLDSLLLLLLNLVILCAGIGCAWNFWRVAGLVPLAAHLAYNLVNGLARSSGGRYLVPTDWVIWLYYAIGLLTMLRWVASAMGMDTGTKFLPPLDLPRRHVQGELRPVRLLSVAGGLLAFLAIGWVLPLSKYAFVPQYPDLQMGQVVRFLKEQPNISAEQLGPLGNFETMEKFLSSPGAIALYGRGLYPRYYPPGEGEPLRIFAGEKIDPQLRARNYPRLTLTFLTPKDRFEVILPFDRAYQKIPHAVDMVAFGCWNNEDLFVDAAVVVVLTEPDPIFLWRRYPAELVCPFPDASLDAIP